MTQGTRAEPTVLHLLARFDFGGVEKRMGYLWSVAGQHRYRHRFAAIGAGGSVERRMLGEGAEVTCLGVDPAIPRPGATWAVLRFLRRIRPDVLHCHGPEPSFHGLLAGMLAGVPLRIGEEFAMPTYSARGAFVFRQVYRSAHTVFCNCEAVREAVVARGLAPRARTDTILSQIRIAEQPLPQRQDPVHFTLVFAGRLVAHKNPGLLLSVLRQLRAEGIPARLWLVGDGPDRQALEQQAEALDLAAHVTFWGYRGDVEEILSKSDVFVLPSSNEGLSMALGEAMGCALPVVATDVGGCAEILDSGHSGFLVAPGEEAPLLEALRALWAMGPEARQSMGERARQAIIEKCDPGRYVARLERFYDSLRSGAGKGDRQQASQTLGQGAR